MTDPRMTPTNDAPVTVEETLRWYAEMTEMTLGSSETGRRALEHDGGRRAYACLAALASAPAGDGVEDNTARQDAWNDWSDDNLTDGNDGYVAAPIWEACWKAFVADWPNGRDAAEKAALVTLDAALARPRAAVGEQSREAIEAECAALIAAYYRREIGTLMQQAEHWAANDKPLAVHHRVMKADDYFQIVCQMERDPAKGWKLPFDEIRDALGRKPIKDPGTYPPSKDLYRYRDPSFVVAALQSPPAKVEG